MKKLIVIGTAVVALGGPLAQGAGAMPADFSDGVNSPVVVAKPLPAPAEQALMLRSQALNKQYHLGAFKYGPTVAEARADRLRGEALNQKYHLGINGLTLERPTVDRFGTAGPTGGNVVETQSESSSPNFQWYDAGIGAAALLGIVALLSAGVFEARHHGGLRTS
jgi:hypothetical protein